MLPVAPIRIFVVLAGLLATSKSSSTSSDGVYGLLFHLSKQMGKMESDFNDLRVRMERLEEKATLNDEKWSRNAPYFLAKGVGHAMYVHKGSIVVFRHVVYNAKSAYNPSTGRFTAPIKGRYLFSATVRPHGTGHLAHAAIYKNGKSLAVAIGHSDDGLWTGTGSVVTVVDLDKNDVIDVREWWQNSEYFGEESSFTGTLLYPL